MKNNLLYLVLLSFIINLNAQDNDSLIDADGNIYKTVKIGNQVWMAENMRVTKYEDGTKIQYIGSNKDWSKISGSEFTYFWYENDSAGNFKKYGALYTWNTAVRNSEESKTNLSGAQGLCPNGWHIPSQHEFIQLLEFVEYDGFKLKTIGWNGKKQGTDDFGFAAVGGGYRNKSGKFIFKNGSGCIWTSSSENGFDIFLKLIAMDDNIQFLKSKNNVAVSVRCVKD